MCVTVMPTYVEWKNFTVKIILWLGPTAKIDNLNAKKQQPYTAMINE